MLWALESDRKDRGYGTVPQTMGEKNTQGQQHIEMAFPDLQGNMSCMERNHGICKPLSIRHVVQLLLTSETYFWGSRVPGLRVILLCWHCWPLRTLALWDVLRGPCLLIFCYPGVWATELPGVHATLLYPGGISELRLSQLNSPQFLIFLKWKKESTPPPPPKFFVLLWLLKT